MPRLGLCGGFWSWMSEGMGVLVCGWKVREFSGLGCLERLGSLRCWPGYRTKWASSPPCPPVSHNRYRFLDFRRIWTLSSQTGRGICRVGLPSHRRRRLGRESEGAAGKYGLHDETTNDFLRQGEEEYTAFRSSLLRTNGRIQRHPPRCEMNGVPIFPSTSTATRTISEPPTVPAHAEPRY